MNNYLPFGTLTLNVSTNVLAESYHKALQQINELINELNVDISSIKIKTVDGKVHKLDVNNFHIEWEDILE